MLKILVVVITCAAGLALGSPTGPVRLAVAATPEASIGKVLVTQDAVPQKMNVQGWLAGASGWLDTTVTMAFRVYGDTTGNSLWSSGNVAVTVDSGLFSTDLGIPESLFVGGQRRWLEVLVRDTGLRPFVEMTSVGFAYKSSRSDTASFALAASIERPITPPIGTTEIAVDAVDSTRIRNASIAIADLSFTPGTGTVTSVAESTGVKCSPNPITASGKVYFDQNYGDGRYVNEGQANSITSPMIVDGTIARTDIAASFKAPFSDTADYARVAPAVDSARISANSYKLQGKDTTGFVRTGQTNSITSAMITDGNVTSADIRDTTVNTTEMKDGSVTSAKILDGTIAAADLSQMDAETGQVMKWTGSAWQPRNDSVGGSGGDNAWARVGGDSVLYTVHRLGVARGGAGNVLRGANAATHVNFGIACTTGTSSPGYDTFSYTVCGGRYNSATSTDAVVAGGLSNRAWGDVASIGGGRYNTCASFSVVAGGIENVTTVSWATVGGGRYDTAYGNNSTVAGGRQNVARATSATVGGGAYNTASGTASTIPGGQSCTATGNYSFSTNQSSDAPNANAAAFNGTTTNADDQTSVSLLKQGFGTFACDHPLDPSGMVLNQYVTGSNEALLTYRGVAVIGSDGRVEARLPDYFDALNRDPMIQLTGVGSSDVVYVAEEEASNRFVIGGRPGMKVFWTVTGERKDPTAEIGRLLQPIEMAKTGSLRGVSLDDAGLAGTMQQLEQMGLGSRFHFRTAAGRQRYEHMRQHTASGE